MGGDINEIWKNYKDGEVDIGTARQQITDYAGGVTDPNWARHGQHLAEVARPSDNRGKSQRPDVRGDRASGPSGVAPKLSLEKPVWSADLKDGIEGIGASAAPAAGWKDAIKGLVAKGRFKASN